LEERREKIGREKKSNKETVMEYIRQDLTERSFNFACQIVSLCQQLDQSPGVSRTLSNQLLRSATSIGANIEEGQGSQSKADFISKYFIACKEARETHYWLRLLLATNIVKKEQVDNLIEEANQLIAILITIVNKCRSNRGL
jgi:four helix bundle protein